MGVLGQTLAGETPAPVTPLFMKDDKPFHQLSEADQIAAIDVACAMSILVSRLPGLKIEVSEAVMSEFALTYSLPSNLAKYALRQVGQTLFKTAWRFNVNKDDKGNIGTYFVQGAEISQNDETVT